MPALSKTTDKGGLDYPFRATVSHADFAEGLSKMGHAIDYGIFKSEVARRMGHGREAIFSRVWQVLHALESGKG